MPLAFPPFGTTLPTVVEPPGGDPDIIAASTWRFDGNSGTVLVSSGFPLQPGQVTSSTVDEVRVYVNDVEQAVAIHPMDGTFPDGSYRSLGIQFNYNLTHDTPVAAEVHVNTGTARGTTDIAWVEPTATIVSMRAVIAPTNPTHLCGTFVTLCPLTPATNDTGVGATWAAYAATTYNDEPGVKTGSNAGAAIYEHAQGLWNLYCRTGLRSWYEQAYEWNVCFQDGGPITGAIVHAGRFLMTLPYTLPTATATRPIVNEAIWNPENLAGNNDTINPAEWYSLRPLSCATAYWMTGWRQFKRHLARYANIAFNYAANAGYVSAAEHWVHGTYGGRYNYGVAGLTYTIVCYLTGCTTCFASPTGFAGPPRRTGWITRPSSHGRLTPW